MKVRVKRHYHERSYGYEISVTPNALELARRAATWLLVYMWRRALYGLADLCRARPFLATHLVQPTILARRSSPKVPPRH